MCIQGKTVLVADDEAPLVHILRFKLEQAGLNVLTASNGAAALAMAQEHQPDLVISDYQMPEMDGLQLCIQLHDRPVTAHIPVLMLTARGHKIAPSDLARTNIGCMMAKPFSAMELLEKITELIECNHPVVENP